MILPPAFNVFSIFFKGFCQVAACVFVEHQNTEALNKGEYENTTEDGTPENNGQDQLSQYGDDKQPFSPGRHGNPPSKRSFMKNIVIIVYNKMRICQ